MMCFCVTLILVHCYVRTKQTKSLCAYVSVSPSDDTMRFFLGGGGWGGGISEGFRDVLNARFHQVFCCQAAGPFYVFASLYQVYSICPLRFIRSILYFTFDLPDPFYVFSLFLPGPFSVSLCFTKPTLQLNPFHILF